MDDRDTNRPAPVWKGSINYDDSHSLIDATPARQNAFDAVEGVFGREPHNLNEIVDSGKVSDASVVPSPFPVVIFQCHGFLKLFWAC